MKKVLSVALASAMVLGMGANAFAITYNTSTNDEADWPSNFQFDGALFVTNSDGDIITDATTAINDNESVDFMPGDVVWMPLYADNQLAYSNTWTEGTSGKDAVNNIKIADSNFTQATGVEQKLYWDGSANWYKEEGKTNQVTPTADVIKDKNGDVVASASTEGWYTVITKGTAAKVTVPTEVNVDKVARTVKSAKVTVNGKTFSGDPATVEQKVNEYLVTLKTTDDAYIAQPTISGTVSVEEVKGTDDVVGKPEVNDTTGVQTAYGHYTGNIDKNWSINLIEGSTGVSELIEKAELYKATATDYASYSKYTDEIMPNAVYLKITLKDQFKTITTETLKYYVYIADNAGNHKTNEVWVSGTYSNKSNVKTVNFTWTNDASQPAIWKVAKGENGVAVFDFADKAFFTVKMYSGESMYLDLSTAYDKAIAGEMDAEADSFYKFDNENANFSRTGELIIVTDDSSLVPYEIDEDGNFVEVDAQYVEGYAIAHTNEKVNGFVFNTKALGNYVLSTEELGQEEAPVEETPAVEEPTTETTTTTETAKPNPETGAEDFVGLAVSLAVVSVAAAGALALKK